VQEDVAADIKRIRLHAPECRLISASLLATRVPPEWCSASLLPRITLHSNKHDDEVELIAFDFLAVDGADLRCLPLSMRKANLQRLLSRRLDLIFVSDFEQGEIGPDLFHSVSGLL
jgi:hypothetical protein